MGWYRDGTNTWQRRYSVSVDNTGGGAGAIDITFTVPAGLEPFWTDIDTSGNELRVVDADGATLLNYSISGFSKTNRTLTISVDGYTAPAAGMLQIFVYACASGAASGTAATVIVAAKTGYMETCGPASPRVIQARMGRPNETRPPSVLAKGSDETVFLWFDLGGLLPGRMVPLDGHSECDEIDYVSYVVNSAGTPVGAMKSATNTRYFAGRYVRVSVAAGTDGTDYTAVLTVNTTEGQVLCPRAWITVRDLDEA